MDKKSKNIGAIWEKKTKAGADMLSIKVEVDGKTYNLTALKNGYKEGVAKRPDWNILPPREMSNKPPVNHTTVSAEDVADDIPF